MVLSVVSAAFAQDAAPAADDQAAPAAAAEATDAAPAAEAEVAAPANNSYKILVPIGCAFIIAGAGFGIGRIGGNAVDAMARQPEAASAIQTAMILAAALIEGATLFALVICLIM
ncbi:MAG: ATP synthase F0 subunit C [Thermoguttaceae bacterium]|nr:ATP synthase F0 subunit C [Thermoguttaceae bacterium]